MKPSLCISFRFIQPYPLFHGRGGADEPEWPPSPLRAFQALLNAACLRTRGKPLPPEVRSALQLLEALRPRITAPRATLSLVGHRAYVPHNHTDLVTAAWDRGNIDASISSHRVEKDVRPFRIESVGDELPALHYLYPLEATNANPGGLLHAILPSVRSIHCLGWGIDQVIADASLIESSSNQLPGECWTPTTNGGRRLRVHINGSLDALSRRHDKFLKRLIDRDWTPVPPLTAFTTIGYRRATDLPPRPFAAFALRPIDDDGNFVAFSQARAVHVAAMLRHAACEAAKGDLDEKGWRTEEWGRRFVAGHGQDKSNNRRAIDDNYPRFSYLPLPTIDPRGVADNIRRVIIAEPFGGDGRSVEWAINRLAGSLLYKEPPRAAWAQLLESSEQSASGDDDQTQQAAVKYLSNLHPCQLPGARDLKRWVHHKRLPHGEYRAIWSCVKKVCAKIEAIQLSAQPATARDAVALLDPLVPDYVVRRYVGPCQTWTSVTPVILPRYVARTELESVDAILRQCLQDAALPFGERDVVIESRPTSWIAGTPAGVQFKRPAYLRNLPAVHIRLYFNSIISGPIAIGAGRHCGLGLCVGM